MIGVDFAGPLKFPKKKVQDGKAYLVLYACNLTRGIYLELLSSLETSGTDDPTQLSAEAPVFRPSRDAAVAANLRVRDLTAENLDP